MVNRSSSAPAGADSYLWWGPVVPARGLASPPANFRRPVRAGTEARPVSPEPMFRESVSPEPEAPRKLAGGANHRTTTHNGHAPAGAAELQRPCRGGRVLLRGPVVPARGLASPPANFRRPCRAGAAELNAAWVA